jgi:hypothetical protein
LYGQLVFSDQESFASYFNTCSDCDGIEALTLSGDITDLSPLSSVDVINGDLVISDVQFDLDLTAIMQVDTIHGLLSIQRVESDSLDFGGSGPFVGGLLIDDCDSLQIVAVMNNQDFAEHIEVSNNDILEEVTVGRRCRYVSGDILIRSNRDLSKLMLTPVVVQIEGSYVIFSSRDLEYLGSEYDSLTTIHGNLGLASLFRLKSITGFNNLQSIGGIEVSVIDSVQYIDAFANLSVIKGSLLLHRSRADSVYVQAFDVLKRVDGLFSIFNFQGLYMESLDSLQMVGDLEIVNTVLKGQKPVGGLFPELSHVSVLNLQGCQNCLSFLEFRHVVKIDSAIFIVGIFNEDSIPEWQIDVSGLDSLRIVGNRNLTFCSVPWICEYLLHSANVYDIGLNAPGCNSRNEIFQNCVFTSDTDETVGELDLELFPNPVRDRLYVESDCENCTYVIRDMAGQMIITGKEAAIDVSHLIPGSYLLLTTSKAYTHTQKFLKL